MTNNRDIQINWCEKGNMGAGSQFIHEMLKAKTLAKFSWVYLHLSARHHHESWILRK